MPGSRTRSLIVSALFVAAAVVIGVWLRTSMRRPIELPAERISNGAGAGAEPRVRATFEAGASPVDAALIGDSAEAAAGALPLRRTLSVVVFEPCGEVPAAGAEVTVSRPADDSPLHAALTDQFGRCVLDLPPSADESQLVVRAVAAQGDGRSTGLPLSSSDFNGESVAIRLREVWRIVGRVTDESGAPAPRACVWAVAEIPVHIGVGDRDLGYEDALRTEADDDGTFSISVRRTGPVRLRAAVAGGVLGETVRMDPPRTGGSDVRLIAPVAAIARWRLAFVDEAGTPLPASVVKLARDDALGVTAGPHDYGGWNCVPADSAGVVDLRFPRTDRVIPVGAGGRGLETRALGLDCSFSGTREVVVRLTRHRRLRVRVTGVNPAEWAKAGGAVAVEEPIAGFDPASRIVSVDPVSLRAVEPDLSGLRPPWALLDELAVAEATTPVSGVEATIFVPGREQVRCVALDSSNTVATVVTDWYAGSVQQTVEIAVPRGRAVELQFDRDLVGSDCLAELRAWACDGLRAPSSTDVIRSAHVVSICRPGSRLSRHHIGFWLPESIACIAVGWTAADRRGGSVELPGCAATHFVIGAGPDFPVVVPDQPTVQAKAWARVTLEIASTSSLHGLAGAEIAVARLPSVDCPSPADWFTITTGSGGAVRVACPPGRFHAQILTSGGGLPVMFDVGAGGEQRVEIGR